MKRIYRVGALCALLVLCVYAGRAWALDVTDVRFGNHPGAVRVVFDLSNKSDFRVFTVADPWRLIIDLPEFNWHAASVPTPASAGVKSMRQGLLQAGVSRIVIDLAKPAAVKTAFILPRDKAKGKPDRLVVDFYSVSEEAFLAQRGSVHGHLVVKAPSAGAAAPVVSRVNHDAARDNTVASAAKVPAVKQAASPPIPSVKPSVKAATQKNEVETPAQSPAQPSAEARVRYVLQQADNDGSLPVEKPDEDTGTVAASATEEPAQQKIAMAATPAVIIPPKKPQRAESSVAAGQGQGSGADSVDGVQQKPSRVSSKKPVIVIDAGHGGIDPGATGAGGLVEKNVTLSVAKELKRQLEGTGRYTVYLTRDNDSYMRLYQRVGIARERGASLFISLHADSIGKRDVRGASIYTLSENASDEETEMLAMRENRADLIAGVDLSAEDEAVVNILVDLTMRDTMNQSSFLANTVVSQLKNNKIKTLESAHRSAGFAVLKSPDVPSILIEMGFMSNKAEAQMLASSSFQQKLARALVASMDSYFKTMRQAEKI